MDPTWLIVIGLTLGTLLAGAYAFAAAWKARDPSGGAAEFFLGGHRLSEGEAARSLFASWLSVGNVVVGALIISLTYQYLGIWAVITWSIGFLVLSRHAEKILEKGAGHTTIHAFLRSSYQSPMLGKITSLVAIITAVGVIALELIVGAALYRAIAPAAAPVPTIAFIVTILAIFATIYTRLGGFAAVIATDRGQAIGIAIAVFALVVIAAMGPKGDPNMGVLLENVASQDPQQHQLLALVSFFLGFGFLQFFLLLGDMTTWQRLQLGSDAQVVRKAAEDTAFSNLFAWGALLAAGIFLLQWPADALELPAISGSFAELVATQAEPLTSMINVFGHSQFHPLVVVLILGALSFGLFSAILSTADSFLLISVQAFIFEWMGQGRSKRSLDQLEGNIDDMRIGRLGRALVPCFMLLSIVVCLVVFLSGIPLISAIFFVFAAQCTISPIAVTALYAPETCSRVARHAYWGILASTAVIMFLFVLTGTASSLSLSYGLSYLAPVVAILIPAGAIMLGSRRLWALPKWMFGPSRK